MWESHDNNRFDRVACSLSFQFETFKSCLKQRFANKTIMDYGLSLPRAVLERFLIYTLTCWYTIIVLARELVIFSLAPFKYFHVKPRSYPEILSRPVFGEHRRVALSNGISLHYVEKGVHTQPLLLFLHGFPEFWYSWRHQLQAMSFRYWCVAVDMRGYGDSSKPPLRSDYAIEKLVEDISLLLDHLGRSRCTLIGHDWGGVIAWAFANAHAEKLERLVVLDCPHPEAYRRHPSISQLLRSWYMFFLQMPLLPEILFWRKDLEFMEHILTMAPLGTTTGLTPEDMEAWKYMFSQPRAFLFPINYYRNLVPRITNNHPSSSSSSPPSTSGAIKLRRKLPSYLPVLVIWGVNDVFLEARFAEQSGHFCNNYRFVLVSDASHWIQQEKPEKVNRLIEDFINATPVAAGADYRGGGSAIKQQQQQQQQQRV